MFPGPHTLIEGIRKLAARALPGVAPRTRTGSSRGGPLPSPAASRALARSRQGRTGLPAARCGAGAPGVGCSAGRVGLGRPRFLGHPALRGAAIAGPLKTFSVSFAGRSFDESRYFREIAQRLRHRPPRVRPEPGSGTAERDRGLRLLFRRAERGRRGAAGLVSLADEPPRT